MAQNTRQTRTTTKPSTRTATSEASVPTYEQLLAERDKFQGLSTTLFQNLERVKEGAESRGLTFDDLLKPAPPADPYAGKSADELKDMALRGDGEALNRFTALISGTTIDDDEPEGNEFGNLSDEDLMYALVDAKRGDESKGTVDDLTAEWEARKGTVRTTEPINDNVGRYGEYTAQQVRRFLLDTPTGNGILVRHKVRLGETGRLDESVIDPAVQAMRQRDSGGRTVPNLPAMPATPTTNNGGSWLPTPERRGSGGRGGQPTDDAEQYYAAQAAGILASRGLTIMDVIGRMTVQQWADLSRGDSDKRRSNHGEPWPIPNLTDGPMAGEKALTTGNAGSDTSFCFTMAASLAHVEWTKRGRPDGDLGDLAQYAKGELRKGPSVKMWERAAKIMNRAYCVGIRPV